MNSKRYWNNGRRNLSHPTMAPTCEARSAEYSEAGGRVARPSRLHWKWAVFNFQSHLSKVDLLCFAACVLFPSAWVLLTTFSLSARQVVFFVLLATSVLIWGRLALLALGAGVHIGRSFVPTYLVGSLLLAFVLAAVRLLTPLSVGLLFGIQLAIGVLLYAANSNRFCAWHVGRTADRVGALVVLVDFLVSTFWLRHLCPLWGTDGQVVVFKPFFEFFFHATHVMPLLLPGVPVQTGSIQFAGIPLAYYHYASYSFPALLASVGGLDVYASLIALWYPLGTFLLGLSAFWLARLLFGLRAGFWSFVAVRVLPDASLWSFGMSMYSFSVFLEATPAIAYATATATVSLSFLILGLRHRRLRYVVAAFAAAFSSVFFKANIFMAISPLIGILYLTGYRRFGRRTMAASVVVLLILASVGLYVGTRLRSAPTIGLDPKRGETFVKFLLEKQLRQDSVLQKMAPLVDARASGRAWRVPARMLFVSLMTFQFGVVFVFAAVVASLVQLRRFRWIHWLLICVVSIYLGSAVLLPPNENGDPFELQQRAYTWAYLVVAIWTSGILVTVWNVNVPHGWRTGYLAVVPLLFMPLALGNQPFIGGPEPLSKGLMDCALYVREHGRPLDVVWDSKSDPQLFVAALSERRAYVCIALSEYFPGSGALRKMHASRVAMTERFKQASSLSEIQKLSRETGVRWFVLHAGDITNWPPDLFDQHVFESLGYRVFDLERFGQTAAVN